MSWDSIFIGTLNYWYDSQDYSDIEMIKWGELLGMKHIKKILEKTNQFVDSEDEIKWNDWLKALKEEINSTN